MGLGVESLGVWGFRAKVGELGRTRHKNTHETPVISYSGL